ncbi:hypothetical protein [Paludibaculum fermentans]|uniref:hypothetical protein n=1 Tax=Paludibaculum fermentans TaxID=1473598 RepID=UPI003EC01559
MTRITIQAKVAGRRGPALTPLELETEVPIQTARELLSAIVRQQLAAFAERKREGGLLKILTERELESGRESGRIASGGQEPDDRIPDAEKSIESAITAFRDGLFFLFVNDLQVEHLEHPLHDIREVLIVRLTALVGG